MEFNGKVIIRDGFLGNRVHNPNTPAKGPGVATANSRKFVFNGPIVLIDSTIGDTPNMVFNCSIIETRKVVSNSSD